MRLRSRHAGLAAAGGLLAALALGVALGAHSYSNDGAASPAVLNHIGARNDEAAVVAAARMKAESEASAAATDARLRAAEAADGDVASVPNAETAR